ncbi:MAG: TetR/AcrR family transcriptional regulator [Sphingomonadales bacterium]|nr:TetR/AcrR family transcriptional regulator [Sphingomonadales bacterium]
MIEEIALAAPPSRREARRHNRREAILDVAACSFLEFGYAATTMNAIAATLGGSKGTLWSYFPSKELLFAAVLERATAAFRRELGLILDPGDLPERALRRFCREFIIRVTSPDAIALHRLVLGEVQRFPEIGRAFHEGVSSITRRSLKEYISAAMANGKLRADNAEVAAEQLTHLCLSGCHYRLLLGLDQRATPAMIAADTERATTTFLRAYG